jgi:hypothetical protein
MSASCSDLARKARGFTIYLAAAALRHQLAAIDLDDLADDVAAERV